jgi:type I restriction-modification system DNA methylase subunit
MKYIIAGMRDFHDYEYFRAYMKLLSPYLEITEVVSGHAPGVDTMAERWAKEHDIKLKIFPADWDKLGKRAGHVRNHQMALYADGLIAFWNGISRGTADMIKTATKEDLEGYVVRTDILWNKKYENGLPQLNNVQPIIDKYAAYQ